MVASRAATSPGIMAHRRATSMPVQLELVQETYMDEAPPFAYRPDRAKKIRPHLRRFVETLAHFAEAKQ